MGFPLLIQAKEIPLLRGVAHLKVQTRSSGFDLDQAIVIYRGNRADFEALDDFGNTIARLSLAPEGLVMTEGMVKLGKVSEKNFARVIPLPMGREAFLTYLLNRLPEDPTLQVQKDKQGRVVRVLHSDKFAKKSYEIRFSHFKKLGKQFYPFSLEVNAAKVHITLSWESVTLH